MVFSGDGGEVSVSSNQTSFGSGFCEAFDCLNLCCGKPSNKDPIADQVVGDSDGGSSRTQEESTTDDDSSSFKKKQKNKKRSKGSRQQERRGRSRTRRTNTNASFDESRASTGSTLKSVQGFSRNASPIFKAGEAPLNSSSLSTRVDSTKEMKQASPVEQHQEDAIKERAGAVAVSSDNYGSCTNKSKLPSSVDSRTSPKSVREGDTTPRAKAVRSPGSKSKSESPGSKSRTETKKKAGVAGRKKASNEAQKSPSNKRTTVSTWNTKRGSQRLLLAKKTSNKQALEDGKKGSMRGLRKFGLKLLG